MNLTTVACLLFLLRAAKTTTTKSPTSEPLAGGINDIDPANEGVQTAVSFAISEHNKVSDDIFAYKLIKIISAKYQVVSGLIYIIEATIGRTTCEKKDLSDQNSINKCPLQNGPRNAKTYTCTFKIWTRAWIQSTQLLMNVCS
ncbi:cystatin-like [Erpetoichthys calabaricus]|uniref:cystatin-like n=1 Tax=Erpetoichthys calabaricus TaxID=27687 RepID=UPI00109F71E0|nr:cystatin-like [Erpetoichthys calabaricus]